MNQTLSTASQLSLPELLEKRHSCRAYLPRPVPHETILELLSLAQRAPSWCNSQPWNVTITEGRGTEAFRSALRQAAEAQMSGPTDFPFPKAYVGIYKDRQRECGWQLYDSVGITQGDRVASGRQVMENFSLFGAPHVAIVTSEADLGTYGVLDCGGYVSAFLLAATHLGLGSIAQAALAQQSGFIRDYFGLPENRKVVCGISFGFADENHPANAFRTRREDVDRVATFASD